VTARTALRPAPGDAATVTGALRRAESKVKEHATDVRPQEASDVIFSDRANDADVVLEHLDFMIPCVVASESFDYAGRRLYRCEQFAQGPRRCHQL
jgi:hypothetical protein